MHEVGYSGQSSRLTKPSSQGGNGLRVPAPSAQESEPSWSLDKKGQEQQEGGGPSPPLTDLVKLGKEDVGKLLAEKTPKQEKKNPEGGQAEKPKLRRRAGQKAVTPPKK